MNKPCRIFEIEHNFGYYKSNKIKNKFVVVYENKDYFVCKAFGTTYPKIIGKSQCIELEELRKSLKNILSGNYYNNYFFVIDRNHEINKEIKIDLPESHKIIKAKQRIQEFDKKIEFYNSEIERIDKELPRYKQLLSDSEKERDMTQKELDSFIEEYIKDQKSFEEFGEN